MKKRLEVNVKPSQFSGSGLHSQKLLVELQKLLMGPGLRMVDTPLADVLDQIEVLR